MDIATYRINYAPEAWKRIAEETGSQCCAPIGAVLAVNALCDEVERLYGAIDAIMRVLGPAAPTCEGCSVEIAEALKIAQKVKP